MQGPPEVKVYNRPPEALVKLLTLSDPLYSLPLVRRLQFTGFPGGTTEHTRILFSSSAASLEDHLTTTITDADTHLNVKDRSGDGDGDGDAANGSSRVPFAAAYLDLSRGPETELWVYSSMEQRVGGEGAAVGSKENKAGESRGEGEGGKEEEEEEEDSEWERREMACVLALLREVKRRQDDYFAPGSARAAAREHPTLLVGNLNEVLRERLVGAGVDIVSTGLYDKFLFRVDELPGVRLPDEIPGDGDGGKTRWVWDRVRPEDIPLTILRTKIPRTERTMKLLPSTALYLDDGTPVAWAFLGPDSSLSSLHCEEPYRGRGIAKAVAVRVLRDHLKDYGGGGYGWADVAPDNTQSQGVCRSLNGKVKWQISWSRLNLDLSFPDE